MTNQLEKSQANVSPLPVEKIIQSDSRPSRIAKFLKAVFLPPWAKASSDGGQRISRRAFLTYTAETIATLAAANLVSKVPMLGEKPAKVGEVIQYPETELATKFKLIFEKKVQEWIIKARFSSRPQLTDKSIATLDVSIMKKGIEKLQSVGQVQDMLIYSEDSPVMSADYQDWRKDERSPEKRRKVVKILEKMKHAFDTERQPDNPAQEKVESINYLEEGKSLELSPDQYTDILEFCLAELTNRGVANVPTAQELINSRPDMTMVMQTKSQMNYTAADNSVYMNFSIGVYGTPFPLFFALEKETTSDGNGLKNQYLLKNFTAAPPLDQLANSNQEFLAKLYEHLQDVLKDVEGAGQS